MIDKEKEMVDTLVREDKLSATAYLLKDGSLEYAPFGKGKFVNIKDFKGNYRWVIGVSKSFNPELCKVKVGKGDPKPNVRAITKLPPFHRTPVARIRIDRIPDLEFAVWYVRLRRFEHTKTPFDGVVKVEKMIVTPSEERSGISSEAVDMISATLINERNPSCYGSDLRFANHLYPVHLTESYVKSTYMSPAVFMNLF